MKQQNKELFNRAAQLKIEIAERESELELLLPDILNEMSSKEADEVKTENGSFFRYTRRKWSYPAEVKVAEDSVKTMKASVEADGSATYEELQTLKFVILKK